MSARPRQAARDLSFLNVPAAAMWSAIALLLSVGLIGLVLGGMFRVQRVQVVGDNLPVDAIIQTAGVSGQNIFTVRSDQVAARLDRIHQIVVLHVDTSFPDLVTIYAHPRPAWAALRVGTAVYEVDARGEVIRQVARTSLPVIVSGAGSPAVDTEAIQAVRYAAQTLPSAPGGAGAQFRLQRGVGLAVVGRAGWVANVGSGSAQTLVNRVATLASLLQKVHSQAHALKFVDLRFRVPYMQYASP